MNEEVGGRDLNDETLSSEQRPLGRALRKKEVKGRDEENGGLHHEGTVEGLDIRSVRVYSTQLKQRGKRKR